MDEVKDVNVRFDKICRANLDVEKQSRVADQSVEQYQKVLQPAQVASLEVNSYLESEPAIGLDADKGKEELNRVEVHKVAFKTPFFLPVGFAISGRNCNSITAFSSFYLPIISLVSFLSWYEVKVGFSSVIHGLFFSLFFRFKQC